MASSSSSYSRKTKHDVFLSFRGTDTRGNFTDHLYAAFKRANIQTFIDYELPRGEEITPALMSAIEGSKISVIVFSENSATSRICLQEIMKILECKNSNGQIVIPVFYKVNPSDVGNQQGSYGDAFAEHEKLAKEDKVQQWRDALKEAAKIAGFHLSPNGRETEFIGEIVRDILKKLNRMSPVSLPKGLVGIESRIKKIESLLQLELPNVRVVGICGMGGAGKTTITEVVYNCIRTQFEASCFLGDVRKKLVQHLRDEIVSQLLPEESLNLRPQSLGCSFISEQLSCKRILLVLDDADDLGKLKVLQKLLGGDFRSLLGSGSRIIMTSRDRQILKNSTVDPTILDNTEPYSIYQIEKLDEDEALELFSWNAFKKNYPTNHIEQSKKVVTYAKGNPLALEVLGSHFFGRDESYWNSALKGLRLATGVHDVLRISYDALDSIQKQIFLDIACFFKGEDWDRVTELLECDCPSAHSEMITLVDKSLVTVYDNKLEMHDLLQEMGRDIVSAVSRKDPGKRSRLWFHRDIQYVLTKRKGTEEVEGQGTGEVEGLFLNMYELETEMRLDARAFAGMRCLRLLKIYWPLHPNNYTNRVHLPPDGLQSIPNSLQLLHWYGFPSTSLASSFCAKNLVQLELPESNIEQLWSGEQNLVHLKRIDLRGCKCLTTLPDLSTAKKIICIILRACRILKKLPLSIQYLEKLEILDLNDCRNLEILPPSLDSKFLRELYLSGCPKVKSCPQISSGNLEVLRFVYSGIEEIPPRFSDKLKDPSALDFSGCSNITKFPEITSINVTKLNLSGTAIKELPSTIEFLTELDYLNMRDCKELCCVSTSICKLKLLSTLVLKGCSKLKRFPEILEPMERLHLLDLNYCENLKWLPDSFHNLKSLLHLGLSRTAIEELPSSIQHLSCLKSLRIDGCRYLLSLPSWINQLRNLSSLDASEIQNLQLLPLLDLCNLGYITLRSCNLKGIPGTFFSSLSSLQHLDLKGNNFMTLPATIKHLSQLKWLKLNDCKLLFCLPELPESLSYLDVSGTNLQSLPENFNQLSQLSTILLSNCKHLAACLPQLPWTVKFLEESDEESPGPSSRRGQSHFNGSTLTDGFESDKQAPGSVFPDQFKGEKLHSGASSRRGHSHLKELKLTNCFTLDQQTRRLTMPTQFNRDRSGQFMVLLPGSGVPELFVDRSRGSSVKVRLPSNSHQDRGIAFCVVFQLHALANENKAVRKLSLHSKCNVKADGLGRDVMLKPWNCDLPECDSRLIESDHILMWYDYHVFKKENWLTDCSEKEASFQFYALRNWNQPLERCEVKECGVLFL